MANQLPATPRYAPSIRVDWVPFPPVPGSRVTWTRRFISGQFMSEK